MWSRSAQPQPVTLASPIKNLCITSYNSTGFGLGVQNYISTLLLFSDIVCVQEHFLQDCKDKKSSNTNKIRKCFGDSHDMYIEPAYKPNSQVSKGRGKGGLVTMWRKPLTKYVSRVASSNFRLQATKFSFPSSSILIINAYFPCDPQVEDFNDTEIVTVLTDIQLLIRNAPCTDILLTGDLNCHFQRGTRFTNLIRETLAELGLLVLWQNPDSDPNHAIARVDYTHCSTVQGAVSMSILDHFVTSQRVYNAISEAGVLHSGDNPSNHSAIFVKLKVEELDMSLESQCPPVRIQWDKATSDAHAKFKTCLSNKLNSIDIPEGLYCTDLHCQEHSNMVEEYTISVMEAVQSAAKESLPISGVAKQVLVVRL